MTTKAGARCKHCCSTTNRGRQTAESTNRDHEPCWRTCQNGSGARCAMTPMSDAPLSSWLYRSLDHRSCPCRVWRHGRGAPYRALTKMSRTTAGRMTSNIPREAATARRAAPGDEQWWQDAATATMTRMVAGGLGPKQAAWSPRGSPKAPMAMSTTGTRWVCGDGLGGLSGLSGLRPDALASATQEMQVVGQGPGRVRERWWWCWWSAGTGMEEACCDGDGDSRRAVDDGDDGGCDGSGWESEG
jgi:hypothetical protein